MYSAYTYLKLAWNTTLFTMLWNLWMRRRWIHEMRPNNKDIYIHIYSMCSVSICCPSLYIYIYNLYIYACVCVCVYVQRFKLFVVHHYMMSLLPSSMWTNSKQQYSSRKRCNMVRSLHCLIRMHHRLELNYRTSLMMMRHCWCFKREIEFLIYEWIN